MHKILAKIARLGVSKAAAFCYAVAVGVAGNLAFNFVQQHNSPPAVTAPPAVQPAGGAAPAAPGPAAATAPPAAPAAVPAPTQVALPAAPEKPMAPRPAAPLPEPPAALALPAPTALPMPALKPTALPAHAYPAAISASPNRAGAAANGVDAGHGEAAITAGVNPPPLHSVAVSPAAPAEPSAIATLPPLGPPIEVALPPAPPLDAAVRPANPDRQIEAATPRRPTDAKPPPVPAAPATQAEPPRSWELSDIWHPARAVEKGLHWAGEQVPAIGRDAGAKRPPAGEPAGPIPLWPTATANRSPSATSDGATAPPDKPGPGSGGLY
ncbi:MAG TPA: hypothetical protein VGQ90_06045 [Stellaceae bacterium]|nr:hypothetical protein [Stellaceae bacterium]